MLSRKLSGGSFSMVGLLALLMLMSTAALAAGPTPPKRHVFITDDNVRLMSDIYIPEGKGQHPAVILLHMLGQSRRDYQPLIAPLLAKGFAVVNLDMRGHGQSTALGSSTISYKQFKDEDWAKLPGDTQKVVKNLHTIREIDGTKLAIVGASIGANAALIAADGDEVVKALILLSPGLDFHKLKPAEHMSRIRRPVLIIAAKDDPYSADSAKKLCQLAPATCRTNILPSGGHGTAMLVSHPELNAQIADWLQKAVAPAPKSKSK